MKKQLWTAATEAQVRAMWAKGQSAQQIAAELGTTRSTISAKLARLGCKRTHKPPTAKPRIVAVPRRIELPPVELTKRQLYEMLAEAAANTARLAQQ